MNLLDLLAGNQAVPQAAAAQPMGLLAQQGDGQQVAANDEMTFARWREAIDRVRRASGVPILPMKDMYEKWLKLQAPASPQT